MIVYISIGNSDDKLTQARWAQFVLDVNACVDFLLDDRTAQVHGRWLSASDYPWQNACWCVELIEDPHLGTRADWLRVQLRHIAATYEQESIAWAEVKTTEFLGATNG